MAMMQMKQSIVACRRLAAAAMIILAATAVARAQNVVVVVNGDPITALDIEQRFKFLQTTNQKSAPTRQQVINELIDEKLKVKEGKRWGMDFSEAEIDNLYSNMAGRMRMSAEQLTQHLAKSGVNPTTLRERLRAETIWQQLVRGRYSTALQTSEKDVELALEAKKTEAAEIVSTDYFMRPILMLVPPGSPGTVYEARRKEAEALRARFKDCEEGIPAARLMRDTAVRDQIIRSSADLPPELRKVLDAIPVGQLTPPEATRHGVEMYAICSKQESKTDSPTKKQAREAIFTERFEEQSKRYMQRLRREALIERK